MKKIKVLHMAPLGSGGITKLTIDINRNIDRNKISFDYLVFRDRFEFAENQIQELGEKKQIVDIEHCKNPYIKIFKKYYGMKRLFKKENYDIVHVDASTPYDVLVAIAAKRAGVRSVVFHSHNNFFSKGNHIRDLLMPFFKMLIPKYSDYFFAISKSAAIFMYPKSIIENNEYKIIKNGIDSNKYIFSETYRDELRREFCIDDSTFVLGNIGRFVYQKNHDFIISVFEEILKQKPKSKLILVGEGELKKEIVKKVKKVGVEKNVIFFGTTQETEKVLCAMDAFIFPSRFEGLGIVAIEAQASDLPTFCAKTIPVEARINEKFQQINGWNKEIWANRILNYCVRKRKNRKQDVVECGYDISSVAKYIEEFYICIEKSHNTKLKRKYYEKN